MTLDFGKYTPIAYINANFRVRDSKGEIDDLTLEPFQKDFFKAGPLYGCKDNRIVNKSRKLGYTMLDSIETICLAGMYPNTFYPLIAVTEDQAIRALKMAKELIADCRQPPVKITNDSVWKIECSNGSEIKVFAGNNPAGVRGPKALKLTLDEFAFPIRAEELLDAASPMLAQGGTLSIISTPYGMGNMYWKIWKGGKDKQKDGFIRLHQPVFSDAEKINVHLPLNEQGLHLVAPWLSMDYLEKERQRSIMTSGGASFLQEYCCLPAEGSYSLFARDDIMNACIDGEWIYNVAPPSWGTASPPMFVGCDFALSTAASADNSVYAVGQGEGEGIEIVNITIERGMHTEDQMDCMDDINRLVRPVSMYVEENSMGKPIFQMLEKRIGVLHPFTTTQGSKASIIRQLQEYLAKGLIKIREGKTDKEKAHVAQWRQEMMAFSRIENKLGTGYKLEGAGEHDDCVMATAIMLQAFIDWRALGGIPIAMSAPKTWGAQRTDYAKVEHASASRSIGRRRSDAPKIMQILSKARGYDW